MVANNRQLNRLNSDWDTVLSHIQQTLGDLGLFWAFRRFTPPIKPNVTLWLKYCWICDNTVSQSEFKRFSCLLLATISVVKWLSWSRVVDHGLYCSSGQTKYNQMGMSFSQMSICSGCQFCPPFLFHDISMEFNKSNAKGVISWILVFSCCLIFSFLCVFVFLFFWPTHLWKRHSIADYQVMIKTIMLLHQLYH
jgi:hypothetical protein